MSDDRDEKPPPLDYEPPGPPPASAAERVGTFLVTAVLTPVTVIAAVIGLFAGITGAPAGMFGLLIALVCGFVASQAFADPRRRSAAIAGAAAGFGICVLLVGACFGMIR